jgi:crotonobetainyl-CoA:carnitine CoA-transferase CaiB-like acyl-CoA transferase
VPAAAVASPEDRIDHDPGTSEFGLWPRVHHTEIGDVRVDGIPVHFSETDWSIEHGGPCLGEHTDDVLRDVLGRSDDEIASLRAEGVI